MHLWKFFVVTMVLGTGSHCFAAGDEILSCAQAFDQVKAVGPSELLWYQAIHDLDPSLNRKNFTEFTPSVGVYAVEGGAMIRLLVQNSNAKIAVIGDFNNWDHNTAAALQNKNGTPYFEGFIPGLKHKMQYRILFNGKELLDPSAPLYSSVEFNEVNDRPGDRYLNSIFWDYDGKDKYEFKNPRPDHTTQAHNIMEIELDSLATNWEMKDSSGKTIQVGPEKRGKTYKFVAESGVINWLAKKGITHVELLPFNSSIDGGSWQFLYQVFGNFGLNSKLGTPQEFAQMIDAFHGAGISVVMDSLVSHFPFNSNLPPRSLAPIGLNNWITDDGKMLFGSNFSPWGTYRYDYSNPNVRRFLIDGILTMLKRYGVDGVRLDNMDGIRYEPSGELFVTELATEVKKYLPQTPFFPEAFDNYSKITQALKDGGLGSTASNFTKFFEFVRIFSQKRTEEINLEILKSVYRDSWMWKTALRLLYVSNHDEATQHTDGLSGQYPASLLDGGGDYFIASKIKLFESLAMLTGSFYLGTPHSRLMQKGNFAQNPAIDYKLENAEPNGSVSRFLDKVANYTIRKRAFAPYNFHGNIENHTDNVSKVMSFDRIDFATGKHIMILINFSHEGFHGYNFGSNSGGKFEVVLNSETDGAIGSPVDSAFRQDGHLMLQAETYGNHGKPHSLTVPYLAPFNVLVLEEK